LTGHPPQPWGTVQTTTRWSGKISIGRTGCLVFGRAFVSPWSFSKKQNARWVL